MHIDKIKRRIVEYLTDRQTAGAVRGGVDVPGGTMRP